MFDQWQLKDFDVDGGLQAGVPAGRDSDGWIAVALPGDTYRALVDAGRIGHPFVARNEADAAWVKDREWWWRTTFEASQPSAGERLTLVLEGLDTFASVYLNGELLGTTDNMFRTWRFDIGDTLRSNGANLLAIGFAPASQVVADREMPLWSIISDPITETKRNFIRKAQFGWGWDWGPRLPTVGIWEPVRLETARSAAIADLKFTTTALRPDAADIRIDIEVDRIDPDADVVAEIALTGPDGVVVASCSMPIAGSASAAFTIDRPQLWWTADLGAQPLYALTVRLQADGQTIDRKSLRVGIRTIALDTSDDVEEPGTSFFRFVLNGIPIFARGACWIPASSFLGAVDDAVCRDLVRQAVDANMNMLRVWGGGVYESDVFFDQCDRMGLLVWQDFMFACAPYPEDDPVFVENVRQEVRGQVRRLRNHASLALWCGSNETEAVQGFMNRMTGQNAPLLGALYYREIMPGAIAELDPTTPYWSSSPSGGPSGNSMRAGDVHHWTVWHGLPLVPDADPVGGFDHSPEGVAYTRYAEDMARFVSEFGIVSAPAMATLRRWMDPADLTLGSEGFLDRIKDQPKDKVNAMLLPVTGLPATLEDYVDFTQLVQAEGLKFGIEHFRRRKPHCSGTLIWQYNDCWPGVSWSLVDHDGVGKSALYATARAYAPVLASFRALDDGAVELWITNDTLESIAGEAVIDLLALAGGSVWSETVPYEVAANASRPVWRGQVAPSTAHLLAVRSPDSRFAGNRHLLAPIKDMELIDAEPVVEIEQVTPHELRVRLSASTYLLSVQLLCDDAATRFDDNFIDLRPGETRVVTVRNEAVALTPADLVVRCWNRHAVRRAEPPRIEPPC